MRAYATRTQEKFILGLSERFVVEKVPFVILWKRRFCRIRDDKLAEKYGTNFPKCGRKDHYDGGAEICSKYQYQNHGR